MFNDLFSEKSVEQALEILKNEIPVAIWETFYVTVLSTFFAVVIGLPLGVLLVVGEKNGVLPLPRWLTEAPSMPAFRRGRCRLRFGMATILAVPRRLSRCTRPLPMAATSGLSCPDRDSVRAL